MSWSHNIFKLIQEKMSLHDRSIRDWSTDRSIDRLSKDRWIDRSFTHAQIDQSINQRQGTTSTRHCAQLFTYSSVGVASVCFMPKLWWNIANILLAFCHKSLKMNLESLENQRSGLERLVTALGVLGATWEHFAAAWGRLGCILGASWDVLWCLETVDASRLLE